MNTATNLDHIVIGAGTLDAGVAFVKEALGVDVPYGGEHRQMGTHNHLMQLDTTTFLEIIAVNEAMAAPKHPRWFGLDDPFVRRSLNDQPSLLTWVVNTRTIDELIKGSAYSLGRPERISRGNHNWQFSLPEDGRLLGGGLLPYAIQWPSENHPAAAMANLGCQLMKIEIFHPYPDWLSTALASIGALSLVKVHALAAHRTPYFSVVIETPDGQAVLKSLDLTQPA